MLNILNLPAITKKPLSNNKLQLANQMQTIKVNPNSNGGIIQLQTGYGVQTNHDNEKGSGKKRETVPPLPPPPHVVLKSEKPFFYYNPNLDDIFPFTPPTYTPPPTPPTIYHKPIDSTYSRSTGIKLF